jgi:hypothetical protein
VARATPLVAEAWTDHEAGRWVYVAALNVSRLEERLETDIDLALLGEAMPVGPVACWNWRTGTAERLEARGGWRGALDHLDWDYRVLAPILPNGLAVVGDPTRYATAGDSRLTAVHVRDDAVRFTVLGAGELVTIVGWAASCPRAARCWTPTSGWIGIDLSYDAPAWQIAVAVPKSGWVVVEVSAAEER